MTPPAVAADAEVDRKCLYCGVDISSMRKTAKYCSRYHKTLAGSQRHTANNPGYYSRYYARRKKHREENKTEYNSKAREYQRERRKNPEVRAKSAQWWAENPEKHRIYQANRRSRKLNNPGSVGVSERDWLRLVNRYQSCCAYCGRKPDSIELDHVIPLSKGGRHAIGNVLPACTSCNRSKNARLLADWRFRR